MPTPSNCVRAITAFVAVVLLNIYAALRVSSAEAAGIVAQANTQPGAPPIFFFLLVLLIFVAVLAFSFKAYRDVNR